MKKSILSIFFFLGIILFAQAQSIKGKIFDSQTKEPVIGATIQILNATTGTTTDYEGNFELATPEKNPILKVSVIGYQTMEVAADAEKSLVISLNPAIEELQSIVVTANREAGLRTSSPIAISKLSYKMIDETKVTSIFEVINKTAGVLMLNLNNEQHQMSIRQPMTTSGYYLYLEDGVPIRPMGVFNHNALLETNQFAISSIEVVKGPVSSIYGPEAVGGAINFISQRPTSVPTAKIGVQFDQWGYRRIQFAGGVKLGKFGIYVGGLASQQINSWLSSSDYDKNIINTRLEYHFTSKTRLIGTFMVGNYFSKTSGTIDSTSFYSRQYMSPADFTYRKSTASRSRLTLEHDWNKDSKTYLTFFHRFNEQGQNPAYSIRWISGQTVASGQINANNFSSYGVIAQHSQQFKFLHSRLIGGGMFDFSPNDYSAYQIDLAAQLRPGGRSVESYTVLQERPDIKLADYKAKIYNSAVYVQYDFEPVKRLRFSLGGRYDRMSFDYTNFIDNSTGSKEYSQLTSKVGLTYDFGNDIGVYANYAQGFAPPALTAIFNRKPNGDYYYDIDPAQFNNYEFGTWMSFFKNKVYVDIAIYQMEGTNELVNIRQPDNSFDYQSAGRTLHRGIELSLTYKPSSEFFFRFSGTTALHKFEDFQVSTRQVDAIKNLGGYEMPSAPRFIWNTELSYYPKWLKNFRSAIEWQHVAGWYQNQINTAGYEGYDLLNFRVGYQWKGIEVYTNVMNVADALYASNSTRGNNATDRTVFTPAAPRTFIVGIQYNFTGKK